MTRKNKRAMEKFGIEGRTYAYTTVEKDLPGFLSDYLGIPRGYPTHVSADLPEQTAKRLAALQSRLGKFGLKTDALEVRQLFVWLFTSFAAYEDFVVYGSKSATWNELEPIVTSLLILQEMDALRLDMTRTEAEAALKGKADYSLVIRLSTTYPRSFVVTSIRGGKFGHMLVSSTRFGVHVWGIEGNSAKTTFFPMANKRNRENAATALIDVARFAAAGRVQDAVWETRIVRSDGEIVASGAYETAMGKRT